jgi:hypothetical protein
MENVQTPLTSPTAAPAVPSGAAPPEEGCCVRLSERDAEAVIQAGENPPEPNAAAVEAARRFLQHLRNG